MRRRSTDDRCSRVHAGAPGRVPSRRWRSEATPRATGPVLPDLVASCTRLVRKTRLPSPQGVLAFFGDQLLANAAAWTAGVMAAGLVETCFEARSIRNLWGLAAWGGRTLVSADDYRMIITLTSYTAGLIMLISMRHLVLRLVAEFRDLRVECNERDGASDPPHARGESSGDLPGPIEAPHAAGRGGSKSAILTGQEARTNEKQRTLAG